MQICSMPKKRGKGFTGTRKTKLRLMMVYPISNLISISCFTGFQSCCLVLSCGYFARLPFGRPITSLIQFSIYLFSSFLLPRLIKLSQILGFNEFRHNDEQFIRSSYYYAISWCIVVENWLFYLNDYAEYLFSNVGIGPQVRMPPPPVLKMNFVCITANNVTFSVSSLISST